MNSPDLRTISHLPYVWANIRDHLDPMSMFALQAVFKHTSSQLVAITAIINNRTFQIPLRGKYVRMLAEMHKYDDNGNLPISILGDLSIRYGLPLLLKAIYPFQKSLTEVLPNIMLIDMIIKANPAELYEAYPKVRADYLKYRAEFAVGVKVNGIISGTISFICVWLPSLRYGLVVIAYILYMFSADKMIKDVHICDRKLGVRDEMTPWFQLCNLLLYVMCKPFHLFDSILDATVDITHQCVVSAGIANDRIINSARETKKDWKIVLSWCLAVGTIVYLAKS